MGKSVKKRVEVLQEPKKPKEKHLRDPKPPVEAKRGIWNDVEINTPQPEPPEQAVKRFGPCQVEMNQAQTAILMLQSKEQPVVIQALNSLQRFCKKREENKTIFIDFGGLCHILPLAYSENQVIQRLAMKLLALSSTVHRAKLHLRNSDAAKDFIQLAQSPDEVIQEYATFTLSSIATLYTGRLLIIQAKGVPVMLKLITHEDPDIQKNAAETIWRILEEPSNIPLFAKKECAEPILALSDSEYPALQIVGLSILEKISSQVEGAVVIFAMHGVQKLGQILSKKELGDLHRVATRILINIAVHKELRRKIATISPAIVVLLDTSTDDRVKINSLHLLGLLSHAPIVAKGLVDFGLVKKLIRIFRVSHEIEVKEEIAFLSAQLCLSNPHAKEQLVEMLEPLIHTLKKESFSRRGLEYALVFMSSLFEGSDISYGIFTEVDGFPVLLDILKQRNNYTDDTIISLITCIHILGTSPESRKHTAQSGFVKEILECMLDTKNPQLLTGCGNAICTLMCEEGGRNEFLNGKGPQALATMLMHQEFPVIVASAPIIIVLGSYPEVCKSLIDQGLLHIMWKRHDLVIVNNALKSAFDKLLAHYLPAKYAVHNHIDSHEKLNDGFYEYGPLKKGSTFVTLRQMEWKDYGSKPVIYVNLTHNVPADLQQRHPSLKVVADEKNSINEYIEEVQRRTTNHESEKEIVKLIGEVIGEKMGGVIDKWKKSIHTEELEIADLQNKYKSVAIPITMIQNGAYKCRAILFKAIADCFNIHCTLERGDFHKMWNVVSLRIKTKQCVCLSTSQNTESGTTLVGQQFVVNLINDPGKLLPLDSYEANAYCFL